MVEIVGNSARSGKFKPTPSLPMRVDITAPPSLGAVCEVGRVPKSGIFLYKGTPLTRPPPLTMVGVARGARKENLVENNDCDKFADRVHDVKNDCRAYSRSILKKMSHSIWYLGRVAASCNRSVCEAGYCG